MAEEIISPGATALKGDLVPRLRKLDNLGLFDGGGHALWAEAADYIEELRMAVGMSTAEMENVRLELSRTGMARRMVAKLGSQCDYNRSVLGMDSERG